MCDFPSALIHRKTRDIVAANLTSHSATRIAAKLGDKNRNYIEFELPQGASLKVRDADCTTDELSDTVAYLLKKWPTRDKMVAGLEAEAAKLGWYYVRTKEGIEALPPKCEGIIINGLKEVEIQAKEIGTLDASAATSVSLPVAKEIGTLDASAATSVSLPVAEKVSYLDARAATSVSLPVAKEIGYLYASAAIKKAIREGIKKLIGK